MKIRYMYCHIFTYAEAFAVNAYLFKYFKYAKVVSRPTTRHGHLLLTYVYILALGSVINTLPHLLYIILLLSSNNNSCLGLISAVSFSSSSVSYPGDPDSLSYICVYIISTACRVWLSRVRHSQMRNKAKTSQLRRQRGDKEAFRMAGPNLILVVVEHHDYRQPSYKYLEYVRELQLTGGHSELRWRHSSSGPECRISHDDPHNFPRLNFVFLGHPLIAKLFVARRLAGPSLPSLLTTNETRISVC